MDYVSRLSRKVEQIQSQRAKKSGAAVRGTITGGYVDINGTKYPYSAATDVLPVDGFEVWCQLTTDGKKVVIVGA